MSNMDFENYLRYEHERLIAAIVYHNDEVGRLADRLAQIKRQLKTYETER